MSKLKLYTKKDGDRTFVATVYTKDNEIVVDAESKEMKQALEEIINRAVREGKVVKRIIKNPSVIKYFGRADPMTLSEEIRRKLKEASEDIPLRPSDPEFLKCLGNYFIWPGVKLGDCILYPKYLEE